MNENVKATPTMVVDRYLEELSEARERLARTSLEQRVELVRQCIDGVSRIARPWAEAAAEAKRLSPGDPARAEDVFTGPMSTMRYLRLLEYSLQEIRCQGKPGLPGKPFRAEDGRLRVPLLPSGILYDRVALMPFKVTGWMKNEVNLENFDQHLAPLYRTQSPPPPKTTLVLGAGNVSSIPLTDTLYKLFQQGSVVLLKMSPVNDYVGPLIEKAFDALINEGFLRIIYGGPEVGKAAIDHPLVDSIHITGSTQSHDRIVWGEPGPERDQRMAAGTPLLTKEITSELGNVSPWIFLPGKYSNRQLAFQGENIAASVINNVSFNCVATKVLITWKQWPQRSQLLDEIDQVFQRTPKRFAYYPGSAEKFRELIGESESDNGDSFLPWTLLRDVDVSGPNPLIDQESFVCILAEVPLEAATPEEFARRAIQFANERLPGTLCAAMTLPPGFRRSALGKRQFNEYLSELKYGSIAVNHWPGIMYGLMTPPWGGYPGATLDDPQSGIGSVHNTFMIEGIEKSVLEGPLTMFPKPAWFPSHGKAEQVAWAFYRLYEKPSWRSLIRFLFTYVA